MFCFIGVCWRSGHCCDDSFHDVNGCGSKNEVKMERPNLNGAYYGVNLLVSIFFVSSFTVNSRNLSCVLELPSSSLYIRLPRDLPSNHIT
jgi:hypothetical protein